jgi:hypothetical protein
LDLNIDVDGAVRGNGATISGIASEEEQPE